MLTELLDAGKKLGEEFCVKNSLEFPHVRVVAKTAWRFGSCAYYRPVYIAICVEKCARRGYANRAWSWPGYVVDRTPYGVIQHELGHHVDFYMSEKRGAYFGDYSQKLRKKTGEKAITGYCPNDAEWFAEIFRLFMTNSDLLRLFRPKVYGELSSVFSPVVTAPWREILGEAPARTIAAAARKVGEIV